jgi:hypothetical protein
MGRNILSVTLCTLASVFFSVVFWTSLNLAATYPGRGIVIISQERPTNVLKQRSQPAFPTISRKKGQHFGRCEREITYLHPKI